MHVLLMNIHGNPNIGLYGVVTNSHVLLGKEVPSTRDEEITKVFGKPIARLNVAGTGLLGVFCLWTARSELLVPSIIFEKEKELIGALGIPYREINTDLTALGNNVLLGVKGAIIHTDFSEREERLLCEALGVPCKRAMIAGVEAVGAAGVVRGQKALFHRDISSEELLWLEECLGLSIMTGTVNMGNPYIKSGVLVGESGMIIGDASGGPEIQNADEALGFIE